METDNTPGRPRVENGALAVRTTGLRLTDLNFDTLDRIISLAIRDPESPSTRPSVTVLLTGRLFYDIGLPHLVSHVTLVTCAASSLFLSLVTRNLELAKHIQMLSLKITTSSGIFSKEILHVASLLADVLRDTTALNRLVLIPFGVLFLPEMRPPKASSIFSELGELTLGDTRHPEAINLLCGLKAPLQTLRIDCLDAALQDRHLQPFSASLRSLRLESMTVELTGQLICPSATELDILDSEINLSRLALCFPNLRKFGSKRNLLVNDGSVPRIWSTLSCLSSDLEELEELARLQQKVTHINLRRDQPRVLPFTAHHLQGTATLAPMFTIWIPMSWTELDLALNTFERLVVLDLALRSTLAVVTTEEWLEALARITADISSCDSLRFVSVGIEHGHDLPGVSLRDSRIAAELIRSIIHARPSLGFVQLNVRRFIFADTDIRTPATSVTLRVLLCKPAPGRPEMVWFREIPSDAWSMDKLESALHDDREAAWAALAPVRCPHEGSCVRHDPYAGVAEVGMGSDTQVVAISEDVSCFRDGWQYVSR